MESAYPKLISTRIRLLHAFILFFVLIYGWSATSSLIGHLAHPHSVIWENSKIAAATIFTGMAGLNLLFVCSGMARRQKKALRLFFIFAAYIY